jgi:hypothetical protein
MSEGNPDELEMTNLEALRNEQKEEDEAFLDKQKALRVEAAKAKAAGEARLAKEANEEEKREEERKKMKSKNQVINEFYNLKDKGQIQDAKTWVLNLLEPPGKWKDGGKAQEATNYFNVGVGKYDFEGVQREIKEIDANYADFGGGGKSHKKRKHSKHKKLRKKTRRRSCLRKKKVSKRKFRKGRRKTRKTRKSRKHSR